MNRQPVSPATVALLKTLCPSPIAILSRCRSLTWRALAFAGERIEIEWECTDRQSRDRAAEIAAGAAAMRIRLPDALLAELTATFLGDRLVLNAVVLFE